MSSKKKNEFREKDYSRNSEGLKQRRLKNESRWKFNPNEKYESEEDGLLDDMTIFEDSEYDDRR
jgi:hypothetical protein